MFLKHGTDRQYRTCLQMYGQLGTIQTCNPILQDSFII